MPRHVAVAAGHIRRGSSQEHTRLRKSTKRACVRALIVPSISTELGMTLDAPGPEGKSVLSLFAVCSECTSRHGLCFHGANAA